jgi:hypothetical protein
VKSLFTHLARFANQQSVTGGLGHDPAAGAGLSLMQNALRPAGPSRHHGVGRLLPGIPGQSCRRISRPQAALRRTAIPIIFVVPSEILLADDGGVSIDISREASLQMETSPDSPATSSTTLVSLWQHNMVAIKAERFVNWKARRSTAAGYDPGREVRGIRP